MDHEEFLQSIDARADGTLAGSEAGRLEAHLADCPPCRGYEKRSSALSRLLAAAPEPKPSEAFVESVLSALPSRKRVLPWISWRLPALAFTAAAALILIRPNAPVAPTESEPILAAAYEAADDIELDLSDLSEDLDEALELGFEDL